MLVEAIISYLIGSINFSYIIGRLLGVDISKSWDKNLGATNLYMSIKGSHKFKIFIAVITGVLDVIKGIVPAILFGPIYSAFAVVGHCFSIISYYFTRRIPSGCGIATSLGWEIICLPYAIIPTVLLIGIYGYLLKSKYKSVRDEMGYVAIQAYGSLIGLSIGFSYNVLIGIIIWYTSIFVARMLRVFEK